MKREEVYKLIDGERDYQQDMGKSDQHFIEDWFAIIDEYLVNATNFAQDGFPAEAEECLLKVAALCVAALEEHGRTPRTQR